MPLQLRSGPANEPVSLSEAKVFLRIDGTDDDILVSSLITAARIYIETTISKILITENWSFFKDKWPTSGVVHLPLSPVQSIDEIRVYNQDNTYSTLPIETYASDLISSQPRIKFLETSPSIATPRHFNQLEVQFTAGFGNTETDVPSDLRQALLMLTAHWYEQREPIGFGGSFNEIPTTISALLSSYKTHRMQ